jgi:hypothetical protein
MSEEELRAEIGRRKNIFRREQAALPFAEKVRIAFDLSKRRKALKQALLIRTEDAQSPPLPNKAE